MPPAAHQPDHARRLAREETAPIPRLALSRGEAAAALGMSLDSFERHVQPTLCLVRLGRMRLVPIGQLERWLDDHAARTLDVSR